MTDTPDSVFNALRNLLTLYTPPLEVRTDDGKRSFHLWSRRNMIVLGRQKKELYFAGIVMHADFVALHFMPVIPGDEIAEFVKPGLLACRKEPSCFHIATLDKALKVEVEEALFRGAERYREKGWM